MRFILTLHNLNLEPYWNTIHRPGAALKRLNLILLPYSFLKIANNGLLGGYN